MDPYWSQDGKLPADLRGFRKFSFTTQDNRTFSRGNVQGQYVLVNFFYATCSGICPTIAANIKKLSARIADQSQLRFVSITVNPELDTPVELRKAMQRYRITQKNWTFLTGDRPQIERLAREQFAGEVKSRKGLGRLLDFVHTENIFLIDPAGYLRGIYRARATGDFDRLLKDLRTLRGSGQVARKAPPRN